MAVDPDGTYLPSVDDQNGRDDQLRRHRGDGCAVVPQGRDQQGIDDRIGTRAAQSRIEDRFLSAGGHQDNMAKQIRRGKDDHQDTQDPDRTGGRHEWLPEQKQNDRIRQQGQSDSGGKGQQDHRLKALGQQVLTPPIVHLFDIVADPGIKRRHKRNGDRIHQPDDLDGVRIIAHIAFTVKILQHHRVQHGIDLCGDRGSKEDQDRLHMPAQVQPILPEPDIPPRMHRVQNIVSRGRRAQDQRVLQIILTGPDKQEHGRKGRVGNGCTMRKVREDDLLRFLCDQLGYNDSGNFPADRLSRDVTRIQIGMTEILFL